MAPTFFQTLKTAASDFMEDKAMRLAAALAYYSVFSLAPLLIIAIAVAGLVFGEDAARGVISEQLSGVIGPQAATAIQDMLNSARKGGQGVMAFVGLALLLLSASGVFGS